MFRPLLDRVLVKPDEAAKQSAGGIIIPDNATAEKPVRRGKVVAVGPGGRSQTGSTMPCAVDVGDSVAFSKYAGHVLKIDEEEFILLSEADILGAF